MVTNPEKARAIKKQLSETFDGIAPHFNITRYKPWPESKQFISTFPKDSYFLDLGCGNGRNSIHLAKEGMRVVGCDISKTLLEIAQNKFEWNQVLDRTQVVRGDISSLPIKHDTFDAVLYIATIHHLPLSGERIASLKEVKRILKPGGKALISAWAQEQDKFREELEQPIEEGMDYGDILLPWKMKDGRVYQRFYHLFSKEEFEDIMKNSGLEVERLFYSADNHYAELKKK